jgi:hypothetical protein
VGGRVKNSVIKPEIIKWRRVFAVFFVVFRQQPHSESEGLAVQVADAASRSAYGWLRAARRLIFTAAFTSAWETKPHDVQLKVA